MAQAATRGRWWWLGARAAVLGAAAVGCAGCADWRRVRPVVAPSYVYPDEPGFLPGPGPVSPRAVLRAGVPPVEPGALASPEPRPIPPVTGVDTGP